MPVERAKSVFNTHKLNCCQSVLHGFQEICGVEGETIEDARRLGGGRAEEGRCGALHGALMLTGDSETRLGLIEEFRQCAGSEYCREIRRGRKFTCAQCVELAATLTCEKLEKTS